MIYMKAQAKCNCNLWKCYKFFNARNFKIQLHIQFRADRAYHSGQCHDDVICDVVVLWINLSEVFRYFHATKIFSIKIIFIQKHIRIFWRFVSYFQPMS